MRSPFLKTHRLLPFWSLFFMLGVASKPMHGQLSYQQPASRVVRNPDGTLLKIRVDPHNQVVEETMEDANKATIWRLVKELDDALQPMRATKYDARGGIISRHSYVYLRGRLEEEEIYDNKDILLSKLVFYYDAKGRMNRVEQFNAKGDLVSVSRASGPGANSTSPTKPSISK
jgi:hypothetical protein